MTKPKVWIVKHFSKKLRSRRRELDLSQADLAELADFHPNTIGKLERGEMIPTLASIILLARALKISPKDLVPAE